jgi:signal-transduction protein with cAMP-binding, CBS, and nucleotidyltransferase domain
MSLFKVPDTVGEELTQSFEPPPAESRTFARRLFALAARGSKIFLRQIVLRRPRSLDILAAMDVSGTIEAILSQKDAQIWSVSPDATVYEAIALMAEKNVGALLVMQGGKLVGIVSERDYSRKVMLKGKTSRNSFVHEIMTTELTTANPRETVEECLRFMTDKRIRHLPVVAEGELRGVISIGDLVKQVISVQSATLEQLKDYIAGGYPS